MRFDLLLQPRAGSPGLHGVIPETGSGTDHRLALIQKTRIETKNGFAGATTRAGFAEGRDHGGETLLNFVPTLFVTKQIKGSPRDIARCGQMRDELRIDFFSGDDIRHGHVRDASEMPTNLKFDPQSLIDCNSRNAEVRAFDGNRSGASDSDRAFAQRFS